MPETYEKTNLLLQKCSFFTESLGCPLPRQRYSGNLFFFSPDIPLQILLQYTAYFSPPTHLLTLVFLKCETGLPGGVFTFYITVDEATADTGDVTVKS